MVKTYQLGLYEKATPAALTWDERLAAAKESGFDFVEYSIDETEQRLARLSMRTDQKKELRRAMEQNGIFLRSICLSAHRKYPLGSNDPGTEARSLEIMKGALDVAVEFGIRTIQLAGYDVYYEPSTEDTRKRFEYNLYRAAEMAAEAGVVMGFETMETPFMNTTRKAMYYVEKVASPYLQVYPDIGNITNAVNGSAEDAAKDLRTGSGHLAALHLKETVPGKFREIPFGTGHVDFERLIKEAYRLGVRRYLAEFWYVGQPDWKMELYRVNQKLRGEFEKILS